MGFQADDILDFIDYPLWVSAGKVNFVDHRNHIQVVIQCQIDVRQGLGFDSLGSIHHQNRSIAGRQASGNLVIKIYMPRRVDEVENIFLPIFRLIHRAHRLGFDGNSPFPLQIHIVEHLGLHFTAGEKPCHLDNAVGQGGFSMINVRNNAEIPNFCLIDCHVFSSCIVWARTVSMAGLPLTYPDSRQIGSAKLSRQFSDTQCITLFIPVARPDSEYLPGVPWHCTPPPRYLTEFRPQSEGIWDGNEGYIEGSGDKWAW